MPTELDTDSMWRELLSSDALFGRLAEVAQTLYSMSWARSLYPWVSHRRLVLCSEAPLAALRRCPSIAIESLESGRLVIRMFETGCVDEQSSMTCTSLSDDIVMRIQQWLAPPARDPSRVL